MPQDRPSGPDWEKWRAKEEAHWNKHGKGSGTYFTYNGQRWKLDNKALKGQPRKFSPKSVDRKNTENKKVGGHRERVLAEQTAPDVDPKAAEAKRAAINKKGNEHHHINSRTHVEKGIQTKYGGKIPPEVRKQFSDVGQYFGDDPRNFADLTIPEHRTGPNAVHKVEKYMDDGIKAAQGSYRGLNLKGGVARMKFGMSTVTEFLPAIDEITGGHLTGQTPQKSVQELKQVHENAKAARKRGGRIKLFGGAVSLPDIGLTEYLGIN